DTSASMKSKLPAVQQALRDLAISMQSRIGENRFSLWVFPGKRSYADQKMEWSTQFTSLEKMFRSLSTQGTTPTGPALEEAIRYFAREFRAQVLEEGLLSDYVF